MSSLESERLEAFLSKLPTADSSKIFKRLVKAIFSSPSSSYFFKLCHNSLSQVTCRYNHDYVY